MREAHVILLKTFYGSASGFIPENVILPPRPSVPHFFPFRFKTPPFCKGICYQGDCSSGLSKKRVQWIVCVQKVSEAADLAVAVPGTPLPHPRAVSLGSAQVPAFAPKLWKVLENLGPTVLFSTSLLKTAGL